MDSKTFSVGTSCLRSSVAGIVASWTDYGSMSFILLKLGEVLLEAQGFLQLGKEMVWLQHNLLLSHFLSFRIFYFQYLWDRKDKHTEFSNVTSPIPVGHVVKSLLFLNVSLSLTISGSFPPNSPYPRLVQTLSWSFNSARCWN